MGDNKPPCLLILFSFVLLCFHETYSQNDDNGIVLTGIPQTLQGYQQVSIVPAEPGELKDFSGPRPGLSFKNLGTNFYSCDVDYARKELYLYDYTTKQLKLLTNMSSKMNDTGTMRFHTIHYGVPADLVAIAIDWISHNIYWTLPTLNWVMMQPGGIMTDPTLYRVVVHEYLRHPRGIAVDPVAGYLFISVVGGGQTMIERMSLTGEARTPIRTTGLYLPNQLIADPHSGRLYWMDLKSIHSCDYNGNNLDLITRRYYSVFFGMAVFKDAIMLTDLNAGTMRALNMTDKTEIATVYSPSDYYLSVCMYHPDNQPEVDKGSRCASYGCADICVAEPPNFDPKCLCREGYEPGDDGKTCIESQGTYKRAIMVTDGSKVCLFNVKLIIDHHDVFTSKCIYTHTNQDEALKYMDLNMLTREIYLATEDRIFSIPIDQQIPTKIISAAGIISGLSYDWVNKDLFWTDNKFNSVHKISMETGAQKTLTDASLNAREITVLPHENLVVWVCEDENNRTQIRNATLDFSKTSVIANVTSNNTRHIRKDITRDVLVYLIDNTIRMRHYNGSDPDTVTSSDSTIVTFSTYKEMLLQVWEDSNGKATFVSSNLGSATVTQASGEVKVNGGTLGTPVAMAILDLDTQPQYKSPCSTDNGECDQICLPSADTRTCSCEFGFTLAADSKDCTSTLLEDKFLLMIDGIHNQMYQIPLDEALPVRGIKAPDSGARGHVVYDRFNKSLVWSDFDDRQIWRMNLDFSNPHIVSVLYTAQPNRIAVDPSSGNIYYTGQSRTGASLSDSYVAVIGPDGSHRTLFKNLRYPRDIVLFPKRGLMFWAESDFSKGAVYRANMDGSVEEKILDETHITGPSGLAIDYENEMLFITGSYHGTLFTSDFYGAKFQELRRNQGIGMDDVVLVGDYLYYTGWDIAHITKMRKDNTSASENIRMHSEFGRPHSLSAYDSAYMFPEVSTECSLNNGLGDCSHICLPTTLGHVCACDDMYELLPDRKTCENVPRCPLYLWNAKVADEEECLRVEGSMCDFECSPNYKKKANIKLTCRNETWDIEQPCEPILCPSVPRTVALPTSCNRTAGSECSNFTCATGYEKNPEVTSLTCTSTGAWSADTMQLCQLRCPAGIKNGAFAESCDRIPSRPCSFTCNQGYSSILESNRVMCRADGAWSVDKDTLCQETLCPDIVEHGSIEEECTRKIGDRCTFNCYTGYEENDDSPLLLKCQPDGAWSHKTTGVLPCKVKVPVKQPAPDTTAIAIVAAICGVFFVIIIVLAVLLLRARGSLTSTKRSNVYKPNQGIENPQYANSEYAESTVSGEGTDPSKDFSYATLHNDRVELTVPSNTGR